MASKKYPKHYDIEMGNVNVRKMGYTFVDCKVLNVIRFSDYDHIDIDISKYDMNKKQICVWNNSKIPLSGEWWLPKENDPDESNAPLR